MNFINDEKGNLSIEASLIIPVIVMYILIIIGACIYIYHNEMNNVKTNRERITDYETDFKTQNNIYEL